MEFYIKGVLLKDKTTCFNSQRDGILRNLSFKVCGSGLFQFPTGWNSTKRFPRFSRRNSKFQFPTGWNSTLLLHFYTLCFLCFNSQRDGILLEYPKSLYRLRLFRRFNSQRDGILQSFFFQHSLFSLVSIPNGMEFYHFARRDIHLSKARFNSQRDGILRRNYKETRLLRSTFQFPTGWNSTCPKAVYKSYLRVSIPNGMEFYADGRVISILQKFKFQFPTGWNSTIRMITKI